MIIDDFDFIGMACRPTKTYSQLIIDSNAVLLSPLALELFEPVARRHAQVIDFCSGMKHREFAQSNLVDIGRNFLWPLAIE